MVVEACRDKLERVDPVALVALVEVVLAVVWEFLVVAQAFDSVRLAEWSAAEEALFQVGLVVELCPWVAAAEEGVSAP